MGTHPHDWKPNDTHRVRGGGSPAGPYPHDQRPKDAPRVESGSRRQSRSTAPLGGANGGPTQRVYLGNITVANEDAIGYVLEERAPRAAILVETHKNPDSAQQLQRWGKHRGYLTTTCDAVPSKNSPEGTNGGAVGYAKSDHSTKFLQGYSGTPLRAPDSDAMTVGMAIPGTNKDLLLLGSYLRDGPNHSSPHTRATRLEVEKRTRGGTVPYIWYLDANATPEELEASGLLDGLKDHTILRPTGADHTCTSGSRRMIDYVVIPTAIRDDIVTFKVDKARPWKPHYGLELEIKKDVGEGGSGS